MQPDAPTPPSPAPPRERESEECWEGWWLGGHRWLRAVLDAHPSDPSVRVGTHMLRSVLDEWEKRIASASLPPSAETREPDVERIENDGVYEYRIGPNGLQWRGMNPEAEWSIGSPERTAALRRLFASAPPAGSGETEPITADDVAIAQAFARMCENGNWCWQYGARNLADKLARLAAHPAGTTREEELTKLRAAVDEQMGRVAQLRGELATLDLVGCCVECGRPPVVVEERVNGLPNVRVSRGCGCCVDIRLWRRPSFPEWSAAGLDRIRSTVDALPDAEIDAELTRCEDAAKAEWPKADAPDGEPC